MDLEKIFIAEISDETIQNDFIPRYQDVWFLRTDNDYSSIADPDFDYESIGVNDTRGIISFVVNRKQYQRVSTISTIISTPETFYFVDKTLLVHFGDNKTPYHYSSGQIKIGFGEGYFNAPAGRTNLVFNQTPYSPRLINQTLLKDKKDDIFFGKQSNIDFDIRLYNQDYALAQYSIGTGKKKFGSFARMLFWEGETTEDALYSEFELISQGVISEVTEGNEIKIKIKDLRTTLSEKTPANVLDNSNFPNIKDGTYRKPQVWGKCFEIPCVCLNEDVNKDIDVLTGGSATNYDFMICDISQRSIASDSIKAVYINNELTDITGLTVQTDTTNNIAYFTIPESNFRQTETNDSGMVTKVKWQNQGKVSIDCYGYVDGATLIENGLEVMRSIIFDVYSKSFISDFFDTATWSAFEATAYDVGYYLNKPKSVRKQMEELQDAQLGTFLYNQDLKFSFDNDDFDSYYSSDLDTYKLLGEQFRPNIKSDPKQVLNTFRIGYKKRWNISTKELSNIWVTNTSNQQNAIENYNSFVEKDFETLLTDVSDVTAYASRLLTYAGESIDTFRCVAPWEFKNIKAGEWLRVDLDLPNLNYLGVLQCQVQEVSPNVSNWTVNLSLRIFSIVGNPDELVDENSENVIDESGSIIVGY